MHSFSLQPRFEIIFFINLKSQRFTMNYIDSKICLHAFAALSHSISASLSLIVLKKIFVLVKLFLQVKTQVAKFSFHACA